MDEEMKPIEETKEEKSNNEPQVEAMDTSEVIPSSANDTKSDLNQTVGEKNESEIKNEPRQRERKKRKKSKKIARSKDYPKYYQNAYVRYCNETRPKICESRPDLDPVATTKLVASMWYALAPEEKHPYLELARIDKERFKRELKEFNKNQKDVVEDEKEPVKPTKKKKKGNKAKVAAAEAASASPIPLSMVETQFSEMPLQQPPTTSASTYKPTSSSIASRKDDDFPRAFINTNCELPIFTDAFLEHNKMTEGELKILRKNNVDLDLENSVLMKHIENMENGVRKVDSEVSMTRKRNTQLEVYLTKLKCLLAANFHSLSIPNAGKGGGATVENIEKYISDLANETKKSHSAVLNKAREILKNVDLKIVT